ncbi:hypothetical protein I203_108423 [Kwoniella mangroviensis CBS 8507]|uniref:hypothetical protein n=1 Tax=Kwoniella mangroviensis CBS 8507 TaxID=1296122 RepID=UPI00080CD2E4|nr:uncharacterized protein I203_05318 [Kwoniella mangroviensis CBS 8507]OCF65639.1 hypothetical protein I203_05318 [Kwoniella mangroviensis CBS 8507]
MSSSNDTNQESYYYASDFQGRPYPVSTRGGRSQTSHIPGTASGTGYDPSWEARARQLGADQTHFSGLADTQQPQPQSATPYQPPTPGSSEGYPWVYTPGHPDLTAELGRITPAPSTGTAQAHFTGQAPSIPNSYPVGNLPLSNLERFGHRAASYRADVQTNQLVDIGEYERSNMNPCRSSRHGTETNRPFKPPKIMRSSFLGSHGRYWLEADCARSGTCLEYLVNNRIIWEKEADTIRTKAIEHRNSHRSG